MKDTAEVLDHLPDEVGVAEIGHVTGSVAARPPNEPSFSWGHSGKESLFLHASFSWGHSGKESLFLHASFSWGHSGKESLFLHASFSWGHERIPLFTHIPLLRAQQKSCIQGKNPSFYKHPSTIEGSTEKLAFRSKGFRDLHCVISFLDWD